jgi:hypothetical protein
MKIVSLFMAEKTVIDVEISLHDVGLLLKTVWFGIICVYQFCPYILNINSPESQLQFTPMLKYFPRPDQLLNPPWLLKSTAFIDESFAMYVKITATGNCDASSFVNATLSLRNRYRKSHVFTQSLISLSTPPLRGSGTTGWPSPDIVQASTVDRLLT